MFILMFYIGGASTTFLSPKLFQLFKGVVSQNPRGSAAWQVAENRSIFSSCWRNV